MSKVVFLGTPFILQSILIFDSVEAVQIERRWVIVSMQVQTDEKIYK
jgi:hypothetical protein